MRNCQTVYNLNFSKHQLNFLHIDHLLQSKITYEHEPAIHRYTTSCTTSSHNHTPMGCLQNYKGLSRSVLGRSLTMDIEVYQGVEDGLHQLVVQRLQVVVPQLQPLQRVQVVKGVVLNGCNADWEKDFCHELSSVLSQFQTHWLF